MPLTESTPKVVQSDNTEAVPIVLGVDQPSIPVTGTFTETSAHAEDSAHVSGDIGSFALAVRNDTAAVLTSADGDYSGIAVDSAGRIGITDLGGSITTDDIKTEDTAHATGALGSFVLAVRNDAAAALTSADGDYSPFATDSAGRIGITDLGGSITTDDIQTEDTPHTTGALGSFVLAVRNDTAASLTSTDGDYSPLATDSAGRIGIADLGGSITVDFAGQFAEDSASGSGDTGINCLAVRRDTDTTVTSVDGDYTSLSADRTGRLKVTDTSATGTNTSVAAAVADTLILASNVNRRGATVMQDGNSNLRLLLGSTAASATNFSALLGKDDYYEVPFGYTGEIRGIWSVATGSARITELT